MTNIDKAAVFAEIEKTERELTDIMNVDSPQRDIVRGESGLGGIQRGVHAIIRLKTRLHGVFASAEIANPTAGKAANHTDLTPEQDLHGAIADMLANAIHFNGCTDNPCTCLVGRLRWAISAEEIRPDQTTAAIDTMARHLIGIQLYAADFGADMWEHIPEVGAHDFEAITKRIKEIADSPATAEFDDAYAHLRTRVDGAA